MSNVGKRTLAVLLAVALTLSNFPEAFFSTITDMFSINMTVKAETEADSGIGTSSNDTGSATETEAEETSTELVVEIEVETEEETSEEAGIMLAATQASITVQSQLDTLYANGTAEATTIKLDGDTTEDIIVWQGLDVTIDLAGYTITPETDGASAITVYGTLTLIDSGTDGAVSNEGTSFTNIRGVDVVQGGSFTMKSGTITGFTVTGNGGGILVENGGSISMTGGTVDGNTASGYGGGVFLYSADYMESLTGGTISNNSAGLSGGGLAANITNSGSITLNKDLTISGNTAATYGGGVYFANALTSLTIKSTISGNTANEIGGGVYFGSTIATLSMEGATIDGNKSAGAGGGCYFAAKVTAAEITDSASISSNKAAGNGGGLWFTSGTSLTLTSGTIDGNVIEAEGALYGGGIYINSANGTRSVFKSTGGTISNNQIISSDKNKSYGAGIYMHQYMTVNMEDTKVIGNTGATYGGGIYVESNVQTASLTNLTVTENEVTASSATNTGNGGGVYFASSSNKVTISGGTYSYNTAAYQGGGIYVYSNLEVKEATHVENNESYSNGGGICVNGQLTLTGGDSAATAIEIDNNTTQNGSGGGAYANSATVYALEASGSVRVYENNAYSSSGNGGGLSAGSGGMHLSGDVWVYGNYCNGNYGGGGLYCTSNTTGTLLLESGVKVYNNTTTANGGGVRGRYHVQIEDGVEIYGNTASSHGGGVCAVYITMNGGKIYGNSGNNGGGIFDDCASNNVDSHICGGSIYNNTARGSGAGIYMNMSASYPNTMYLEGNVEIYGNTSSSNGGGVYAGDRIYIYGGSIHDNTAAKGGGVFVNGYKGQTATIEIAAGGSGIIYDNTATTVNAGNDVALNSLSSTAVYTSTNNQTGYTVLTMDAASSFTDSDKGITGSSWYDELKSTNEAAAISTDNSTSGEHSTGAYYTFVYTTDDYVAKVWNKTSGTDGDYEEFTTVQAAVTAVAGDSSGATYGNEDGSTDPVTIIMIKNSREDVTIPEGLSVTLDLAGFTLKGMATSTITVESNATLIIEDSSVDLATGKGTGAITGGSGQKDTTSSNTANANTICGGGLFIQGSVTLNSGIISGNKATYGSGVYIGTSGCFTINGGSIESNTTSSRGGGIYIYDTSGDTITDFYMTGGSITENKSSNGGGIYAVYSEIEITGGSITGNTATSSGGGIFTDGKSCVNITDAEIIGNTAVTGGGLYINNNQSTLTVDNDLSVCKLYGNTASSNNANDIYVAMSGNGTLSLMDVSDMDNSSYNSWLDTNADDKTNYQYYYESGLTWSGNYTHAFYLTATNYSGGYVAYIPSAAATTTVYQVSTTEGTTYTMDFPSSGTVTASDSGTAYVTLQAAINAAAESGDTIYLLCDVEESVSLTKKSVTVDLNGYTISTTSNYGFYMTYTNNSNISTKLTLRDTSSDTAATSNCFHNSDQAAVGTLTVAGSNSSDFPQAIYMETGNASYPSSLTLDGVLIEKFGDINQAVATGSSTYSGAAVYAKGYSRVTINANTVIQECNAYCGGAVYVNGTDTYLTINDGAVISGNTAYQGGGIYYNYSYNSSYIGEVTIRAATISDNSAYTCGGMFISGWNSASNLSTGSWPKVEMTGTIISGNSATYESGGVFMRYVANVNISGCEITGNSSNGAYGGIRIYPDSNVKQNASITITNCNFKKNTAVTNYAGLYIAYGKVEISDCDFEENESASYPSALCLSLVSEAMLKDCDFTSNVNTASSSVLYLTNCGTVSMDGINVNGNSSASGQGAIYIYNDGSAAFDTEVTLTDCTISQNGGHGLQMCRNGKYGLYLTLEGTDTVGTTISENAGYGVYVHAYNSTYYDYRDGIVLNIKDNTFISSNGNNGVYLSYSTLNMYGGEIYDNTTTGNGGGVNAQQSNFNMYGGSIYNNTALHGGGVYLVENVSTYGSGTYTSTVEPDTITGGKIYGNTSTFSSTRSTDTGGGGGIYVGDYDELIMTGGSVTDNTTARYGGGVYMSTNYASFELGTETGTVGQVYDNTALLGQDVYAEYNSSYANTSLELIAASTMLTETADGKTGIGWLDEARDNVITTDVSYSTVKKYYPLTLKYVKNTTVAVIWNGTSYDEFTSVQDAVDALEKDKSENTGKYYTTETISPEIILVDDVTGDVEVSVGTVLTLNLNGYTLEGDSTAITCYGTMTIKDVQYSSSADVGDDDYCAHYTELAAINQSLHVDGNSTTTKTGAGKDENGVFYTGTISGYAAFTGGGIAVYSGGSVTMTSGQIANCTAGGASSGSAYGGAGVYIENGSFVLGGDASITGCSTKSYGSAVYISGSSGTFTMQDNAVIENNSANSGTVYVASGTFKMTGGTIANNTASSYGGGVYSAGGTTKIIGGTIASNTATNRGGGMYIGGGTVTLSGAIIEVNSVTGSSSTDVKTGAGGGIYLASGTLNIKTGTVISDNSATRGGGIYQENGTINMTGGQITGNSASYGGGVAQYPTYPGVFTMKGGVLCDNTSALSSAGNDFYSVTENGYNYTSSGVGYSTATLVRAADMDYSDEGYYVSCKYNVWKDDSYTGAEMYSETIGSGMYITGEIITSTGLMLTADSKGDSKPTVVETSTYYVTSVAISQITDGTKDWDSIATGSVTAYKDASGTITSDTWDSTSSTNPLAAEWTAGNDSSADNGLVRSYDTVKYDLSITCDNEESNVSGSGTVQIKVYMVATLPVSSSEAKFSTCDLDYYTITEADDDTCVLEGYAFKDINIAGGSASASVTVQVYGMKNGSLVEPTFKCWVEGNSTKTAELTPTAVTVSAAGMYDITLLRNTELAYTGYFDLSTGDETTEDEYLNNNADGNIIYGTMLGYGITLSMRNASTSKGKKGMESPEGDIEFDLTLTGSMYIDGVQVTNNGSAVYEAPYVWAYKANANTESGNGLNNTLKNAMNMNWNDEDDIDCTTQYAYDAAPFNEGNNNKSCYSGGYWSASGDQPTNGETETIVHFTVSGYDINTTDSNPKYASDGVTTTNFDGSYIKSFSAGYIQVIFPIDTDVVTSAGESGYLSIGMESIVGDLDITTASGAKAISSDTSDPEDEDVSFFVDWYGDPSYTSHAVSEVTYLNNYVGATTGLYVGTGDGENLVKKNYFHNASNDKAEEKVEELGTGSTPIGSVVYIGSRVNFYSNSYDTTDRSSIRWNEDFDSQTDNVIERDYLTAVNILQKFDANAYTPASTTLEVINRECSLDTQTNQIQDGSGNVIFEIDTTEVKTTWSTKKTMSYTLTILYAAKPTGDNWEYRYDPYNYLSPMENMDETTEEDLIYFATLQDLYDYFGGYDEDGNPYGQCVGILYEFRDCCIRNDRSISVNARTNVTNDFERTGNTYCVTNDALGWTTYRPIYKKAYSAGTLAEQLFDFTWVSVATTTAEGITYYGTGDDTYPGSYTTATDKYQKASGGYAYPTGNTRAKLEKYNTGYIKTEYSLGWVVSGTHNGWYSGNTLLLYTMESSIDINITDTVTAGSNVAKTQYDLGTERTARFEVIPKIQISSGVSNELVTNGTQSTTVEITITLPNHLNFDEGSITFDYSDKDCGYSQDELSWSIVYTKSDETDPESDKYGTATIVLTTSVTDISKQLPVINYSCTIGKPGASTTDVDEAENGETLTTVAEINVTYEEINSISTNAKRDKVSLTVSRGSSDSIWIEADYRKELGEDIEFSVFYSNDSENASSIELVNVLPYVGDGRGTSFSGGYLVDEITLTFNDKTIYDAFLASGALFYGTGAEYYTGDDSDKQATTLDSLKTAGTVVYNGISSGIATPTGGTATLSGSQPTTAGPDNDGNYTVTFDLESLGLTQYAETSSGMGFYLYFSNVAGKTNGVNSVVQVDFTLSPTTVNNSVTELIKDSSGKTQESENIYYLASYYKLGSGSTTPINSNYGKAKVMGRTLSGVAWMDQDHDGIYNTATDSTDETLCGIEVYLYSTLETDSQTNYDSNLVSKDDSGNVVKWTQDTTELENLTLTLTDNSGTTPSVTLYPVIDVLGNLVEAYTTGTDGKYSFTQLAATQTAETYYVVFKDASTGSYTAADSGSTPISFSQLSVTVIPSYTTNTGNLAVANYGTNTSTATSPASLVLAEISGITMPELSLVEGTYALNQQNGGWYYRELTVEKIWENMFTEVEAGTEIKFTITGQAATGTNTYENVYVLTQDEQTTAKSVDDTTGVVTATDGKVSAEVTTCEGSVGFEKIIVSGTGEEYTSETSPSGLTKPSLTVSEVYDADAGLSTITWSLGTISLQAEDNGEEIEYEITSVEESVKVVGSSSKDLIGYVQTNSMVEETASGQPKSYTATATNTQILYELKLYKISSSSNGIDTLFLQGAKFTLYTTADCTTEVGSTSLTGSATGTSGYNMTSTSTGTDSETGEFYIGKLAAGTYYLKETVTPSGYELNKSVWEIKIEYATGKPTTPDITITQVIDENGDPISQTSSFTINPTNVSTTGTTDSAYVTPDTTAAGFTGTDTLYTISFELENEVIYSLPSIGRGGIGWTTLGGIALMLLAVWLLLREKEKNKIQD